MKNFFVLIGIILLMIVPNGSFGQNAKVLFDEANTAYNEGKYTIAEQKLDAAVKVLGSTNPLIQSLRTQVYFAEDKIIEAKVAVDLYFKMIDPKYVSTPAHLSMISIRDAIDQKLQEKEKEFVKEKERVAAQGLKAAINMEVEQEKIDNNKVDKGLSETESKLSNAIINSNDKDALQTYLKYFNGVRSENTKTILAELNKFENPNEFLFNAVTKNDIEEVNHLLKNGGNPNLSEGGNYLVHVATKNKSIEMLDALSAFSADFNKKNANGYSLLHQSVELNKPDLVRYFVAKGVSVNTTNSAGDSPLTTAAYAGNIEMLKILVSLDANKHFVNKNNVSAAEITFDNQKLDCFKYLLSQVGPDLLFSNQYSAVYNSIQQSKLTYLVALLEAGAAVNKVEKNGWYALLLAAYKGDYESAKLLLKYKADVNCLGPYDWSPLHYAAKENHKALVDLLMAYGADPSLKDIYLRTAKRVAKEYGNKNLF